MNIIVVTPPPVEPITLAEAYSQLRLDAFGSPAEHPDEADITRHIATARTAAEQATRRALVQQTLRIALPGFPCQRAGRYIAQDAVSEQAQRSGYVELLRPPYISMVSVEYYDTENVLRTLSSSNYYVNDSSDIVARLQFVDGFSMATYDRDDAVRISWIAGYLPVGSPADDYTANIPAPIKSAMLLSVQLLYENFKPQERAAMEGARDALLASFTVASF